MKPLRALLLLAAVLAIPACDRDEDRDVDLTVVNSGTATVHCEVEYYDTQDDDWKTATFDVAAGGSFKLEIFERWADVLIIRIPDGAVMFNEVLEWHDFSDDDARITVYP